MAQIKQEMVDDFTATTTECLKSIRAYLAYEGDNKKYLSKAKVAATTAASAVKLLGTVASMESNEIMRHKLGMKAGG